MPLKEAPFVTVPHFTPHFTAFYNRKPTAPRQLPETGLAECAWIPGFTHPSVLSAFHPKQHGNLYFNSTVSV